MSEFLTTGTLIECNMGVLKIPFIADDLPGAPKENGLPVATMTQVVTGKNIASFGMCNSIANPAVVAATAAAQGVKTPAPCMPFGTAWLPPSFTAKYLGLPLARADAVCACALGGVIKVTQALPAIGRTS